MAASNFQKRFVEPIRAGIKTQTIRPVGKRRHSRPGEKLQLFTGQRTRSCAKIIDDPFCLNVVPVSLDFRNGAHIEINKQWQPVTLEFAIRDGFDSVDEMTRMFTALYGDFKDEMLLISWGAMPEYQSTFFDPPVRIARKSDPISSQLAANELTESGKLAERERVALALVNLNPGKTGEELDRLANATKREISKRLAGLDAKNQIRRGSRGEMRACEVTGRLCLTWWPWVMPEAKS